jgi:membrane associated rhomboid family serine protease
MEDSFSSKMARAGERFKFQVKFLIVLTAVLWAILIVNYFLLDNLLLHWGVRPLETDGLWGILFMPFLHVNPAHMAANTLPFVTLGWLVMARRTADFFIVSGIAMFIGGVGVWLFGGAGTVHVGPAGWSSPILAFCCCGAILSGVLRPC